MTREKQMVAIRVHGIVQGVGFRFTTRTLANMHGVAGWVAGPGNCAVVVDGTCIRYCEFVDLRT